MRDSVPLGRYFDLFKHLCAANVLVAALALVMLPWVTAEGGTFDALVLGLFFASFVLAATCLSFAVAVGVALPLVVTFSA